MRSGVRLYEICRKSKGNSVLLYEQSPRQKSFRVFLLVSTLYRQEGDEKNAIRY